MSKTSMLTPFLRVSLFHGLKPLQITEISRNAERLIFCDGDIITRRGEEGYAAYLIVSGRLLCRSELEAESPSDAMRKLDVEEGALIDEMAMLIDGHACAATVVADGQVRAYRLARAALHEQMEADPHLADHFVQKIAARLGRIAEDLRQIDGILAPDHQRQAAP